jgi:hypothetical protein
VASALASLEALVRGVNTTDLALGMVEEDILGRAVETLEEKFGDQPLIDARLRGTIGETYRRLGRYERAEPQLEADLETQKRVLGDDHPYTLTTISNRPSCTICRGATPRLSRSSSKSSRPASACSGTTTRTRSTP